jgi:hypothetical protein
MEVSHGCFCGPPAQFDTLRLLWADAAGYGVTDYRDVGGPIMPDINFDVYSDGDALGEWPGGAPDDPLMILLVHEEHVGRIKVSHIPYLADRLEDIESRMFRNSTVTPAWVLLTQQFIRGLRTAASYKQDVVFS